MDGVSKRQGSQQNQEKRMQKVKRGLENLKLTTYIEGKSDKERHRATYQMSLYDWMMEWRAGALVNGAKLLSRAT